VGPAGGVARIDDDRQVAQTLDVGHGAQVEHVAGRFLERAHAALAEDDVGVPLGQDVLGRHEQVLDGGAHGALEQDRLARLADLLEQVKVLHVAGADLEHVGIALDQRHLARVHDLGHHRHTVAAADVAQDLQALLAQALEAVGAGARLERAAAQDVGAGLLDVAGDLVEDLVALDGAGAGDHRHRAAADLHLADGYHRVALVELAAGELVRLHDRQGLLDAGDRQQRLGVQLVLVADDADDRAVLALADVRLQAELVDALDDVLELGGGGVGAQDDDHGSRFRSVGWFSPGSQTRAAVTPRPGLRPGAKRRIIHSGSRWGTSPGPPAARSAP